MISAVVDESLFQWGVSGAVGGLVLAVVALWKSVQLLHAGQLAVRDATIAKLEMKVALLEERERAMEDALAQVRKENAALETRMTVMEGAHVSSPLPMWIKDPQGKVMAANAAYGEIFLEPRGFSMEDFVGHTDGAVWPAHVAAAFGKTDAQVWRTGKLWDGVENVTDAEGIDRPCRVIKYVWAHQGVRLGVAGVAVPARLAANWSVAV